MKITLEHISKSFDGKKKVLDDLSIVIQSESLTTLLGFSGCGKTTLLRLISGLECPDDGRILFDEKVVFDKEKHIDLAPIERGVAFVFQDFALWPNMSALKNVEYALQSKMKLSLKEEKNPFAAVKKHKEEIKSKAMAALSAVHMEEFASRLPGELSGGQKQRVALARAIAINPEIILLDEPLSALDAVLRQAMRKEIKELVTSLRVTAVFVTHDQEEAMSLSDEIVIMAEGKIIEHGRPEDIYWHPKHRFVAEFIGKASFVNPKVFLRPEDIHLEGSDGDVSKETIVESCLYQGGCYHIVSVADCVNYYFTSESPLAKDAPITLYYQEDALRPLEF